jgi:hypothetical protein
MAFDYHYILLIVGILLFILSLFSDIEIIFGRVSFAFQYSLLLWPIVYFIGTEEPSAFLYGFIIPFIVIFLVYTAMTTGGVEYHNFILKEARVTVPIPIDINKTGEVTFEYDGGTLFLQAKSDHELLKPIPKDTMIRILGFEGQMALVSTEIKLIERSPNVIRVGILNVLEKITPKARISGTCMICFGSLVHSTEGVKCPACKSVAHKDHMEAWVDIKNKCPHCRREVKLEKHKIKLVNNKK